MRARALATPCLISLAVAVVGVSCSSTARTTQPPGSAVTSSGVTTRPPFEISPAVAPVTAGSTVQFTVPAGADVSWGVSESKNAPAAAEPTYPLKVSPNGRYLMDQKDQPWRVQADAAWLMSAKATPAQVDTYLTTRKSQGFNSFYLMAMVHPGGYSAAPSAPNDVEGDPPFATPGLFSTAGATAASERYWTWIDTIIDKAAAQGIVVMLSYTYLGYGGGDQGWYHEVEAQPNQQALFDWGKWLGNRYKDKANIIWFGLGDFSPPTGSEGSRRVHAIADGIKAAGARQVFMAEPSPPDNLPAANSDFTAIIDQNSFYGYGPGGKGEVYQTADRAWRFSPTKPGWMEEGTYEGENNTGSFSGEPWDTRRGRYWSVLGGGTAGDGFGSKDAWQWNNIPGSLSTPGARYSTYAFDLFGSMPWWQLRPSGTDPGFAGKTLITSGGGKRGDADFVTSALSQDRAWLVAYVPVTGTSARTFSVDMSAMAGASRARWFDPTTGDYLAISNGYEYPPDGPRVFTTPGGHQDSTNDWVLVLDATGNPSCGTITPAGLYTAPSAVPEGITCQITAAVRSETSAVATASIQFG